MTGDTARTHFDGIVAVVAPHMDDEVLGCGLLLADPDVARRAHIVFVTDGSRSPVPPDGPASPELAALREGEAKDAAAELGIAPDRLHFLGLPDGGLADDAAALERALLPVLKEIGPDTVLVPFRRDHHPDHLAVNATVRRAVAAGALDVRPVEYFVYSRWRLLPGGDLRRAVRSDRIIRIEPGVACERKRVALSRHRSQVTRLYDWQRRPILTPELVARVCAEPEWFVVADADGRDPLTGWGRVLVPVVQRVEPVLKRWKDAARRWR